MANMAALDALMKRQTTTAQPNAQTQDPVLPQEDAAMRIFLQKLMQAENAQAAPSLVDVLRNMTPPVAPETAVPNLEPQVPIPVQQASDPSNVQSALGAAIAQAIMQGSASSPVPSKRYAAPVPQPIDVNGIVEQDVPAGVSAPKPSRIIEQLRAAKPAAPVPAPDTNQSMPAPSSAKKSLINVAQPNENWQPGEPWPGSAGTSQTNVTNIRPDGTTKGPGFLGRIQNNDGSYSTELTVGVNIDGKEVNIPTLVPTLSKEELQFLQAGGDPRQNKAIMDKAIAHARQRMAQGQSPYVDTQAQPKQSQILTLLKQKLEQLATPPGKEEPKTPGDYVKRAMREIAPYLHPDPMEYMRMRTAREELAFKKESERINQLISLSQIVEKMEQQGIDRTALANVMQSAGLKVTPGMSVEAMKTAIDMNSAQAQLDIARQRLGMAKEDLALAKQKNARDAKTFARNNRPVTESIIENLMNGYKLPAETRESIRAWFAANPDATQADAYKIITDMKQSSSQERIDSINIMLKKLEATFGEMRNKSARFRLEEEASQHESDSTPLDKKAASKHAESMLGISSENATAFVESLPQVFDKAGMTTLGKLSRAINERQKTLKAEADRRETEANARRLEAAVAEAGSINAPILAEQQRLQKMWGTGEYAKNPDAREPEAKAFLENQIPTYMNYLHQKMNASDPSKVDVPILKTFAQVDGFDIYTTTPQVAVDRMLQIRTVMELGKLIQAAQSGQFGMPLTAQNIADLQREYSAQVFAAGPTVEKQLIMLGYPKVDRPAGFVGRMLKRLQEYKYGTKPTDSFIEKEKVNINKLTAEERWLYSRLVATAETHKAVADSLGIPSEMLAMDLLSRQGLSMSPYIQNLHRQFSEGMREYFKQIVPKMKKADSYIYNSLFSDWKEPSKADKAFEPVDENDPLLGRE